MFLVQLSISIHVIYQLFFNWSYFDFGVIDMCDKLCGKKMWSSQIREKYSLFYVKK